ncbi:hypothetical protein DA83_24885 [Pseudomonas sp. 250J]|nr:hypothetical protein DA83_24885 [Pseudomonas sp. 250J]
MGEEKTVDDFIGTWLADCDKDFLDDSTIAHGGVDTTGFGDEVFPVVGYGAHPPFLSAEYMDAIKSKFIKIDFLPESVEADWFVAWKFDIHADKEYSCPIYAC